MMMKNREGGGAGGREGGREEDKERRKRRGGTDPDGMEEERGRFLHRRMSGPQLGPMICMYVVDCLWRSKQLFNLIARCYVGTVSFPIHSGTRVYN